MSSQRLPVGHLHCSLSLITNLSSLYSESLHFITCLLPSPHHLFNQKVLLQFSLSLFSLQTVKYKKTFPTNCRWNDPWHPTVHPTWYLPMSFGTAESLSSSSVPLYCHQYYSSSALFPVVPVLQATLISLFPTLQYIILYVKICKTIAECLSQRCIWRDPRKVWRMTAPRKVWRMTAVDVGQKWWHRHFGWNDFRTQLFGLFHFSLGNKFRCKAELVAAVAVAHISNMTHIRMTYTSRHRHSHTCTYTGKHVMTRQTFLQAAFRISIFVPYRRRCALAVRS